VGEGERRRGQGEGIRKGKEGKGEKKGRWGSERKKRRKGKDGEERRGLGKGMGVDTINCSRGLLHGAPCKGYFWIDSEM
jgi:hypothetical protein